VVISPYVMHHHPDLWEDPERFIPERFDPERTKGESLPFFPFLTGPRNCIGQHLALTEAMVILVMLLKQYSFRGVCGYAFKMKYYITNVPVEPVWMTYEKRK